MTYPRVLYVPDSDAVERRRCERCRRVVQTRRVRYYTRNSGRLVTGVAHVMDPHRAPCGAHCAGARRAPDFRPGQPVHTGVYPCACCAKRANG